MKNFTKMNKITAAILAVLMMTAGILQTVPVSAAIKEADVFLNSNWSYAGESTPFEDGGWLQAICDTEDYIIGVENASNTSTDPDTLVAFYKNNYDENGNPVQQYSYAKHVTEMDYEHCNGMTYDPVNKRILIAGGKPLKKGNKGCIFIVDSESLKFIEKVKITDEGRVSAVDYWEKTNQFVFLIGTTQTTFKFVVTDLDFNVVDEFDGLDSSAGNTFQDFCISGDYAICIPFMKRTDKADNLQVYSLTERRLAGTYGLELEGGDTYVEPESICEIGPGELLIGSMLKDPNRVTFYTTKVAAAFSVRTDVQNGTVTESQQVLDEGTDFTVNYEPEENYELREILVDGQKQNILEYPSEYTFTNLQDDHEIDIYYTEIPEFPIVLDAEGGTLSSENTYVRRDQDVNLTWKADEHYELDWLMVNGQVVDASKDAQQYTVADCQEPVKAYAYFKEKPIFQMEGEVLGGKMQVKSQTVYRDDDYTVTYQPYKDYEFAHLYIDGKEITNLTEEQKESYTFENVQEGHSIRVEYRWKYLPLVIGAAGVFGIILLIFLFIRFVRWVKRRRAEKKRESAKKDAAGSMSMPPQEEDSGQELLTPETIDQEEREQESLESEEPEQEKLAKKDSE